MLLILRDFMALGCKASLRFAKIILLNLPSAKTAIGSFFAFGKNRNRKFFCLRQKPQSEVFLPLAKTAIGSFFAFGKNRKIILALKRRQNNFTN